MNKICLVLVAILACANAFALTGREIMQKHEDARKVGDLATKAKLISKNAAGSEKVKEFRWWRKIQKDQVHYWTLTRFDRPAEVKGEGILFIENAAGTNDVLLYLPAYKKIRRVETQQQSGSFMGSDFSYSDIASPHVDDYRYSVARDEACPDTDGKCYVVLAEPASDVIRDRTGYTKSKAWVRQDNFMVVRAEYDDLEGKLYKRMDASEIKVVEPQARKWFAHRVKIMNLKAGGETTLQFSDVKVNGGLADSLFTQQNLSSGK